MSDNEHDLSTEAPSQFSEAADRAFEALSSNNEAEQTEETVEETPEGDESSEDTNTEETKVVAEEEVTEDDQENTEGSDENTEEAEEASDDNTEEAEEASDENDQTDTPDIPESLRGFKEDDLQTDEGKALYKAFLRDYKNLESGLTKATQASKGAEKHLVQNEEVLRGVFKNAGAANPSFDQMTETVVNEFVSVRTDANYARKYYDALGEMLGVDNSQKNEETVEDDDLYDDETNEVNALRKENESFRKQILETVEGQKLEAEQEKVAAQESALEQQTQEELKQEYETVNNSEEFSDYSNDKDFWKTALLNWSENTETSFLQHARAEKTRIDNIVNSRQKEYLKKKTQQPKVGAGKEGSPAAAKSEAPKSFAEAAAIAESMLS